MIQPTDQQKRFFKIVANMGCVVSGMKPIQVHHIWDPSIAFNTIGNIGHWAILPIWIHYHRPGSSSRHNVTHSKTKFEAKFGRQGDIFAEMIIKLKSDPNIDQNDLPPFEVVQAIMRIKGELS